MTGLLFICKIFSKTTSILLPSFVEEMALKLLGYQPKCTLYFHNILSGTILNFYNPGPCSTFKWIYSHFRLFLLRSSFFTETETVSVSFSGNGKIWHEDPIIVTMNNNWTENYCHFSTKINPRFRMSYKRGLFFKLFFSAAILLVSHLLWFGPLILANL